MKKEIPLFKVFMNKDASQDLEEVLQSGFIGQGKKVEEFEKKISLFLDNPFSNTVNSATSGIHLCLHYIKNLDQTRKEVITTPLTCTATNFPIVANDLNITWSDIDKDSLNICLKDVRSKINKNTLALVVVHWAGNPCNLKEIENIKKDFKEKYNKELYVIEDCAHALGSKFKNTKIGNSSNFCVFSFQAIKHLTTGDGGLITCKNQEDYEKIKLLRWYGIDRNSNSNCRFGDDIKEWGFKFHMNDIAASIGISNLKYVSSIIKKHNKNFNYIKENIKHLKELKVIDCCEKSYSSNWIMTLLIKNKTLDFMNKLKSKGIATSKVHTRNDTHSCLKEFRSILPNMDFIENKMCCIPCGWWMEKEDLDYVVKTIREGW